MTQRRADKVAKADPELAKKVAHGEVSLPKAVAKVSNKPIKREAPPPELREMSRDDMEPSAEEQAFLERKQQEFQDRLQELLDASEPLAVATQRWKQAELTIAGLQARINGLVAEKAELIKAVKYWRRQAERAEQADA